MFYSNNKIFIHKQKNISIIVIKKIKKLKKILRKKIKSKYKKILYL